jgi:phospholipid transport system substrate-binding protein
MMTLGMRLNWMAGLLLTAAVVRAGEPAGAGETAYDVVRTATEQVMQVIDEADGYVEEDPERYYREIQAILDPVVDYRGFARGVMGPYATSERYRSLDEAGRARLRDQLDRFTEVMRVGLVRTYGKGLLAFGSSRIEIDRPEEEEADQSRVSVRQRVYSDEPEPYILLYQMGRDGDGEWKLRNVIIESVNLGEIYRNQFQAAAREYDGDLDEVIDTWTTVEVET